MVDIASFIYVSQNELVNNPDCPRMCAYKLVTVKFKWWGLQNRIESFLHKVRVYEEFRCKSL